MCFFVIQCPYSYYLVQPGDGDIAGKTAGDKIWVITSDGEGGQTQALHFKN